MVGRLNVWGQGFLDISLNKYVCLPTYFLPLWYSVWWMWGFNSPEVYGWTETMRSISGWAITGEIYPAILPLITQ